MLELLLGLGTFENRLSPRIAALRAAAGLVGENVTRLTRVSTLEGPGDSMFLD